MLLCQIMDWLNFGSCPSFLHNSISEWPIKAETYFHSRKKKIGYFLQILSWSLQGGILMPLRKQQSRINDRWVLYTTAVLFFIPGPFTFKHLQDFFFQSRFIFPIMRVRQNLPKLWLGANLQWIIINFTSPIRSSLRDR